MPTEKLDDTNILNLLKELDSSGHFKQRDLVLKINSFKEILRLAPNVLEQIISALELLLKQNDFYLKILSAEALGKMIQTTPGNAARFKDAILLLIQGTTKEKWYVRDSSLCGIEYFIPTIASFYPDKLKEIIPILILVTEEKNKTLREDSVKVLGKIIQTATLGKTTLQNIITTLEKRMNEDDDKDVRLQSLLALEGLVQTATLDSATLNKIHSAVSQRIQDSNPRIRIKSRKTLELLVEKTAAAKPIEMKTQQSNTSMSTRLKNKFAGTFFSGYSMDPSSDSTEPLLQTTTNASETKYKVQ